MKFLVDAQLPRKLLILFHEHGFEAIHTLDLSNGNRSTDVEIIQIADEQALIVVTKDDDFLQSHQQRGTPKQLLIIQTGNISNRRLEALVREAIPAIEVAFKQHDVVKMDAEGLVGL